MERRAGGQGPSVLGDGGEMEARKTVTEEGSDWRKGDSSSGRKAAPGVPLLVDTLLVPTRRLRPAGGAG